MLFQATVLEEMPPFPERESSILAKLKKKKPHSVTEGAGDANKTAQLAAQAHSNSTEPAAVRPSRELRPHEQVSLGEEKLSVWTGKFRRIRLLEPAWLKAGLHSFPTSDLLAQQ